MCAQSGGYPPIADYAILGDCHSAALVSRDGAIDWFCPSRFDAPALFCRTAIRRAILTHGFDSTLGAFTQAFDSPTLDASALAIPQLGFLSATDPRMQSTVRRLQQDLTHEGLLYRYQTTQTDDGLPGGEGTFAMCTFALVSALALGGRLDDAHQLFEHMLGFANDVGLLAEEIDASTGALLGNFPQGFSHLALIRSAVHLARAAKHGPEHRATTEAERAQTARDDAADGASPRS